VKLSAYAYSDRQSPVSIEITFTAYKAFQPMRPTRDVLCSSKHDTTVKY